MLQYIIDSTPKYMLALHGETTEIVPLEQVELYDAMCEAEEARRRRPMMVGLLFAKEHDFASGDECYFPFYERLITRDGSNWHKGYETRPVAYWDVLEHKPILPSEK